MTGEMNSNLEKLFSAGVGVHIIPDAGKLNDISGLAGKPDLAIDAIFGTGFRGPLEDFYQKLIQMINKLGTKIVSIDIPSGLNADTGCPEPEAVIADVTVTLGYPKIGFKNKASERYTGKIGIADIGLPEIGKPVKWKTIKLRSGKAGRHDARHPWIYKNQILSPDAAIKPGDTVKIVDPNNAFLGIGYYNPKSEISARVLSFEERAINGDFFKEKISNAVAKRNDILTKTNAYRAVFSEADSLPGLIIDVYNDTAVYQILTLGMERFKPFVIEAVKDIPGVKYIYEKSISAFRKIEGIRDIYGWHGDKGPDLAEIFEQEAKFFVDIVNGHKTGFYLDQRKARMALRDISKDKSVLDLFSYTGAFAVTAAKYGARSVQAIDIKDDWLEMGKKNAELNGVSDRIEFIKKDAFKALEEISSSGEKFDIIILDPPSFLKSRESIASASKGYEELNLKAMKALNDGGVLATFSCSHNMPTAGFSELLKKAAASAGKSITILKRCRQAEDHPIVRSIPETEYLKGYFLKVEEL
jgi:23S rRNA (cytosine1962-C5)-methyltransferase